MLKIMTLLILPFIIVLGACSGGGSNESQPPPPPILPPPVEVPLVKNIMDLPLSVNQILLDGESQLAATSEGLYWRESNNAVWSKRSPLDTEVTGIVVVDAGYYIAALTRENANDIGSFPLYRSVNSGESWELIEHDFGRQFNDPIYALAYDKANDKLYATSAVALAVSDKNAQSWTLLSGFWDGLGAGLEVIRIDHINDNIWFGGQGAIENGTLSKYSFETNSTENWQNLLPDPSAFRGGLIHPVDFSTVIFSGEGGLVITTDDGLTWSTPLGDVGLTFYFDVVIDDSMIMYTAQRQGSNPEQALIILCSSDNGTSWITNDFSTELTKGGTLSLMITEEADTTMLYLGLLQNGIKAIDVSDLSCG
jgi:hypothetical protein